jgi:hypothetical protein
VTYILACTRISVCIIGFPKTRQSPNPKTVNLVISFRRSFEILANALPDEWNCWNILRSPALDIVFLSHLSVAHPFSVVLVVVAESSWR